MTVSEQRLREAVDRLYEVFRRYHGRPDMPLCEHCMGEDELRDLLSVPLAEVSAGQLSNYVWHAIGTVGEVVDYKHFLPRIFETMLCEDGPISPELIVGSLVYAEWGEWPAVERAAVSEFFPVWWEYILSRFPAEHDADDCLLAIVCVRDDLPAFLAQWRQQKTIAAMRHLAVFIDHNYGSMMQEDRLGAPSWEECPDQMREVICWITAPVTGEVLEKAFFEHADAPFAEELSTALQQWEWIRKARSAASQ